MLIAEFIPASTRSQVRHALIAICVLLLFSPICHAQTTISGIDDNAITNPPNDTYNDNGTWAWEVDPGIGGCGGGVCHATAQLSPAFDVTIDGQAMRLDLIKLNDGCSSGCWTDAWYGERIYHNGMANGATSFTLDLYLALDSSGVSNSQAVEFNMEQDFQDGTGGWSIYKYSWQCDYKGTGQWTVWDGGSGRWVPTGAPCVAPFSANSYDHYVFHATRLSDGTYYYNDFWVNNTHVVVNYQTAGHHSEPSWEDNLFTWIQLDSDTNATSYTAWVDQYSVTYQ